VKTKACFLLLIAFATLSVQFTPTQSNHITSNASLRDSTGPVPPWRDSTGPVPPWNARG
jgi:hypothetical protein